MKDITSILKAALPVAVGVMAGMFLYEKVKTMTEG